MRAASPDNGSIQETAQRWVAHLSSGRISSAELAELNAWLGESRAHRLAFEEQRATWRAVQPLQAKYRAVSNGRRRVHARVAGGVALAAAFVLALVYLGAFTRLAADHVTRPGEITTVSLPDGSVAELNTDSAIAIHYSAQERRVDLVRGEAWFHVMSNRARPFRVHSQNGLIEAVGTAFAVRASDNGVVVSVTEGRVAVTSKATAYLHAGEQTSYEAGERPRRATAFDTDVSLGWRQKRVTIEALPLARAIDELDRYLPGRILLLDRTRADIRVSGVFAVDDLEEGLRGFAASQNLHFTQVTPYLTILY